MLPSSSFQIHGLPRLLQLHLLLFHFPLLGGHPYLCLSNLDVDDGFQHCSVCVLHLLLQDQVLLIHHLPLALVLCPHHAHVPLTHVLLDGGPHQL